MPEILIREELMEPRTAGEMLDWVLEAHGRFNTRELKAEAREGKHHFKELIEEALPIALFAYQYYEASEEVQITHVVGNQSYDATVSDHRTQPSPVELIEATVTEMTYEESLRMEALSRDGTAAAYGRVEVKGSRGAREVLKAEHVETNHDKIRDQHLAQVSAAIQNKLKKDYPENTALVVRVDDALPFRDHADVALLDKLVKSLLPDLAGRFKVLALVGSQGLYLQYSIEA